jgi:hypothetical protein
MRTVRLLFYTLISMNGNKIENITNFVQKCKFFCRNSCTLEGAKCHRREFMDFATDEFDRNVMS